MFRLKELVVIWHIYKNTTYTHFYILVISTDYGQLF